MKQKIDAFDLSPVWEKVVRIDNLKTLETLYSELNDDVAKWMLMSGLSCPSGCGTCCTGFTPDITSIEAEFLALFIMEHTPSAFTELENHKNFSSHSQCPLYAASSDFHCSVYPARPLICRLFGFSGMRDKAGMKRFSLCRHMPSSAAYSRLLDCFPSNSGREIKVDDSLQLPVMSIYGGRVEALDYTTGAVRKLLPEAVTTAVTRMRLKLQYLTGEAFSGNNGNTPETPPDGGFSGSVSGRHSA